MRNNGIDIKNDANKQTFTAEYKKSLDALNQWKLITKNTEQGNLPAAHETVSKSWNNMVKHTGTVLAMVKLDDSERFSFKYDSVTEARLNQEDNFASAILHGAAGKIATAAVSKSYADHLENNKHFSSEENKHDFIQKFNKNRENHEGFYPVLNHHFQNFPELLSFLRTPGDKDDITHLKLLSILWEIPACLPRSENAEQVNALYGLIQQTKEYKENNNLPELKRQIKDQIREYKNNPAKPLPNVSNQFGNSGTSQENLFGRPEWVPFLRSADQLTANANPQSPIVRKMAEKNLPFVSGLSGMTNLICHVLDDLQIDPRDASLGRPFCEAMAAFIVGSTMHSYVEVYKVFNMYTKLLNARQLIRQ